METSETQKPLKIDLDQLLEDKSPRAKRFIPKFILRYLKRIIHQDEVNKFLADHQNVYGVDFADAVIKFFNVKINVINPENIPETGRYLVVSNHPLGGLDGLALISTFGQKRKDLYFPVNDLLLYLQNMNNIFLPINKHGRNSSDAVRVINEKFASDALMLYFPAGLCSRKTKGEICDLDWKKTVVSKAKEYNRDIIPVHFEGKNSKFFYNLANFRKRLGLKANVEMLYLSDEMFKQNDQTFTITVGEPISHEEFTRDKKDVEWAQWIKTKVYELPKTK
ncbi:MAG: glycerol acyltransferase [Bacteroidales bacterium]|jgi:putative hemolysin|nr:glycerol acyltransferase [Bacteroidales bacterium]